jgi:hypothetical protein
LATVGLLMAGEAGVALKRADIKAEPFRDAKTIGSLARGERVDIVARDGGWYRIKFARLSGWVRMLSVRRGAPRKLGNEAEEWIGVASGRAGTGRVVSTTGIRGLTADDLKKATYSDNDLKKVDGLVVAAEQAQKFAAEGKLAARRVDYLPEGE